MVLKAVLLETVISPLFHRSSLLPRNEVHDPTATDVRSWLPAVPKDVGVDAASFLQSVGQFWHSVEHTVVVDSLGQAGDGAAAPLQPSRVNVYRAKRVAENIKK